MASLAKPRMLSKEEESSGGDVDVRHEDQLRINKFSRLHRQQKRLEDELKSKEKDLEDLEEISLELELADEDEVVKYKVGECFVSLSLTDAQERLSSSIEEIKSQISASEDSLSALKEQMGELKAELYARFGRNINLET